MQAFGFPAKNLLNNPHNKILFIKNHKEISICNQKILIINLNPNLFQANYNHRINFQLNNPTKILLVTYHSHNIRFQHLIISTIINFSHNNQLHIFKITKVTISNLLLLIINLISINQFKILMQVTKGIKIKVIIIHNQIIIKVVIKKIQNNITIN
jgi:hypothetical protein